MKRAWLLLPCLITVLLAVVVAWLIAPHGYPYAVYYLRSTFVYARYQRPTHVSGSAAGWIVSSPPDVTETWIDPGHDLLRSRNWNSSEDIILQGQQPTVIHGFEPIHGPLPVPVWPYYHMLTHGGFGGLGRYLLSTAIGPVVHEQLDGRSTLRFSTTRFDFARLPSVVWLDARSRSPVRAETATAGHILIDRMVTRRRAADSLPRGFFDLPACTHQSFWDRSVQWFRDHLHR